LVVSFEIPELDGCDKRRKYLIQKRGIGSLAQLMEDDLSKSEEEASMPRFALDYCGQQ